MFVPAPPWHRLVTLLLLLAWKASAWAGVSNGDFESGMAGGTPPSWSQSSYLNPGVQQVPVQSRAELNLGAGGVLATNVVRSVAGNQTDANLGPSASLRWPWQGVQSVLINAGVTAKNVNALRQTLTVTEADIDPADGKIHLHGVIAPVFEEGSHQPVEEQYVFIQAINLSRGNATLYQRFLYASEAGVPWKTAQPATATFAYTDWQLFDIHPGNHALRPGDTVQLEVVVAACALGAHQGYAYLDAVGTGPVSGLSIQAQGPSRAAQNTDVTYTHTFTNQGATTVNHPTLQITLPPNTSFQSLQAPAGYSCTTPTVGAAGTVQCQGAALTPQASGSLSLTVHVNSGASGSLTHGNYRISGDTERSALGPAVITTITPTNDLVSLSVTVSNGRTRVAPGEAQTYQVRIRNDGPSTANQAAVSVPGVADLLNMAWTCTASGGGSCQDAAGQGGVASAVTLPVGAEVVYVVTGTVSATPADTRLSLAASVTPAELDTQPSRNADADTDLIGTDGACDTRTHQQLLEDSPTQNLCTQGNASAVTLSDTTYLWSCQGSGAGTTASCQATHAHPVTPVADARGTWAPASTQWVLHGQTTSFTLSPARGYTLTGAQGCQGSLTGGTYTTGIVEAACSLTAQWTAQTYAIGGTLSGLAAATSITVRNNGEFLTLSQNGSFVFATPVVHAGSYAVDVVTQPTGQTCTVSPAQGTVDGAAVTQIQVSCAATPVVTHFSGSSPTGTGTVTADLAGPAGCGFASASLTSGSASGLAFPHGLFQFTTNTQCAGSVTVTLTYPQPLPAQARYWKWGPTPDQAAAHWYTMPATLNNRTVTFTVVDGGLGDDDLSANGTVADPGGVGISATSVPTLSEWMTWLLAASLLGLGVLSPRARAA